MLISKKEMLIWTECKYQSLQVCGNGVTCKFPLQTKLWWLQKKVCRLHFTAHKYQPPYHVAAHTYCSSSLSCSRAGQSVNVTKQCSGFEGWCEVLIYYLSPWSPGFRELLSQTLQSRVYLPFQWRWLLCSKRILACSLRCVSVFSFRRCSLTEHPATGKD